MVLLLSNPGNGSLHYVICTPVDGILCVTYLARRFLIPFAQTLGTIIKQRKDGVSFKLLLLVVWISFCAHRVLGLMSIIENVFV